MAKFDETDALRSEYAAQLNAKSDEIAGLIRQHGEAVGEMREHLHQRNEQTLRVERLLKEERAAHDETKGELMDAMLQIERLRGYLNALQDMRPPRMVEQAQEPQGADRTPSFGQQRRYSDPPAKHFFERGAR